MKDTYSLKQKIREILDDNTYKDRTGYLCIVDDDIDYIVDEIMEVIINKNTK